jgi:ankyrin repeat protein
MDTEEDKSKYYKEGANIVGWPDENGIVEVLFDSGAVRRYNKLSHTRICKYTFSNYYEEEDSLHEIVSNFFCNYIYSSRDLYNYRKHSNSHNNYDYDGDYASDGFEIEWRSDYKYLNRVMIPLGKKFIPDEKDVNYPIFKGNPKNKKAMKKFRIMCIFYEKNLIERERRYNNLGYILVLIKKGYIWDAGCFNWALENEDRIDILEAMMGRNQDPDRDQDSDGWTPLLRLSALGGYISKNRQSIKVLIMNGANIDHVGYRSKGSFRSQLELCEQEVQDDFDYFINPPIKSVKCININ